MIKNSPLLLLILSIIVLGQIFSPNKFFNNNKLMNELILDFNGYIFNNLIKHNFYINKDSNNILKEIKNKKNIDILISNHYSTIDFVLIFYLLNYVNRKDIIILLKNELMIYPGVNNIINNKKFIKLNRSWDNDKDIIKNFIENIDNGIILLFPEGTRICPETINNSIKFSKNNNLVMNKNLLFPRVKGLYTIISILMKENKLGNLYDITSIVPDITNNYHKKEFDLLQLFNTNINNSYHIIRKIKIPEFNYDYETFKKWLYHMWNTKDFLISNYKNYNYNLIKSKNNNKNIISVFTLITLYIYIFKKYPVFMTIKTIINYIIPVLNYVKAMVL